jgi:hypothetical protein
MSDQESTENEPAVEAAAELAAEYLNASDEEADQDRIDEIESEIRTLKSERDDVAEDVGEDNFVVGEYEDNIQSLEEEREKIRESAKNVSQRRNELLNAAGDDPGFQFDEHWLNSDVIRALNEALHGEQDDKLVIADHVLCEGMDFEELTQSEKLQIKKELMYITQDRVSDVERVEEHWANLEGTRSHQAFMSIVENPGVGPSEIAKMHDDASKSAARNWVSKLANQDELKMVHTPNKGEYQPSTIGKYYAAHYAEPTVDNNGSEVEASDPVEQEGDDTETVPKADDTDDISEDSEQHELGNSAERPVEQSDDSGTSEQGATVTSAEAESTDEKKQAMFENVGKRSDSEEH